MQTLAAVACFVRASATAAGFVFVATCLMLPVCWCRSLNKYPYYFGGSLFITIVYSTMVPETETHFTSCVDPCVLRVFRDRQLLRQRLHVIKRAGSRQSAVKDGLSSSCSAPSWDCCPKTLRLRFELCLAFFLQGSGAETLQKEV